MNMQPLSSEEETAMEELHIALKVDNTVYYADRATHSGADFDRRYNFKLAVMNARDLRDELDRILSAFPVPEKQLEAAE